MHGDMTTCSNVLLHYDKVVASLRQVAQSIKRNVVSAHTFVNMVRGDNDSVTWYMLVCPIVS